MKVLLVNSDESSGGAARAAWRLHQALVTQGVESQMLVASPPRGTPGVQSLHPSAKGQLWQQLRLGLELRPLKAYAQRSTAPFWPATVRGSGFAAAINASDCDVVHLHWLCGAMMRIEDLAAINKPLVWSLHDMWPFTGGCNYDAECGRFRQACGACPHLRSSREGDLSRRIFQRKRRAYGQLRQLTVVGLSSWLSQLAAESPLFAGHRVRTLPNPIDAGSFAPLPRAAARAALGLPQDRPLVAFGAMGGSSDPRKGFAHLRQALQQLPEGIEAVVFGAGPGAVESLPVPLHALGQLHDELSLRLVYSAVDCVVVPSLQENLSNVILEAMSCACPVVAFALGGNGDLVQHHDSGYLARPGDAADLAAGIQWLCHGSAGGEAGRRARARVLAHFDQSQVVPRYQALYEEVLGLHQGAE